MNVGTAVILREIATKEGQQNGATFITVLHTVTRCVGENTDPKMRLNKQQKHKIIKRRNERLFLK